MSRRKQRRSDKRGKRTTKRARHRNRRASSDDLDILTDVVSEAGDGWAVGTPRGVRPQGDLRKGKVSYELGYRDPEIEEAAKKVTGDDPLGPLYVEHHGGDTWSAYVSADGGSTAVPIREITAPADPAASEREFRKAMGDGLEQVFRELENWGETRIDMAEERGLTSRRGTNKRARRVSKRAARRDRRGDRRRGGRTRRHTAEVDARPSDYIGISSSGVSQLVEDEVATMDPDFGYTGGGVSPNSEVKSAVADLEDALLDATADWVGRNQSKLDPGIRGMVPHTDAAKVILAGDNPFEILLSHIGHAGDPWGMGVKGGMFVDAGAENDFHDYIMDATSSEGRAVKRAIEEQAYSKMSRASSEHLCSDCRRATDMVTVECPAGHRWEVPDDKGMDSDVFDEECPECGLTAKYVV